MYQNCHLVFKGSFWFCLVLFCKLFKNCQYFGSWGRKRTVPVLQVPAGEEGGPGGFPNLLKEEEQEEDEEKKKDSDDE